MSKDGTGRAEPVKKDVSELFKTFSASEKIRVQEHQRSMARRDKAVKLNDLKKFAHNFKLNTPVPEDLLPILARGEEKQKTQARKPKGQIDPAQQSISGQTTHSSNRQSSSPVGHSPGIHTSPSGGGNSLFSRITRDDSPPSPSWDHLWGDGRNSGSMTASDGFNPFTQSPGGRSPTHAARSTKPEPALTTIAEERRKEFEDAVQLAMEEESSSINTGEEPKEELREELEEAASQQIAMEKEDEEEQAIWKARREKEISKKSETDIGSFLDPYTTNLEPSKEALHLKAGSVSSRTFSSRQTYSNKSYSTEATTVSRNTSSGHGILQPKLTSVAIAEERENDPDVTTEQNTSSMPEDYESTISADSIDLTASQRSHIIAKFSKAILENLPSTIFNQKRPTPSSREFFIEFETLLKEYSVAVKQSAEQRSIRLGSKAIRRLRSEIVRYCAKDIFDGKRIQEESRILPNIAQQAGMLHGHMTLKEKIQHWASPISDFEVDDEYPGHRTEHKETQSRGPSSIGDAPGDAMSWSSNAETSTEELEPEAVYPSSIDDREIYDHLTHHPSFSKLLFEIRESITRFQGTQMEHISSVLEDLLHQQPVTQRSVTFVLEWDIIGHLESRYDDGLNQDLGSILTLTGQADNADLRTVQSYMKQTWPGNSSDLLNAIKSALSRRSEAQNFTILPHSSKTASVEINNEVNTFIVRDWKGETGVKYVIEIAQQLAWLTAACREFNVGMAYSMPNLVPEPQPEAFPTSRKFHISAEMKPIPPTDPRSCWNTLFSGSVLVTGFPTMLRENQEKGLATSLAVTAGLVGIPFAITYSGGYILKGRFHALVPIERKGNAVQWHMIDTWPSRLSFNDIRDRCPKRLLKSELREADLWSTAAFIGWCPRIANLIATEEFEYSNMRYSKAVKPPRRIFELTGGNFGFSKFITANLNVSFGKTDGVHMAARSDFYEGVLDDAQDTHALLYDTQDRRCWHTTVDRLILHIMLHRKQRSSSKKLALRTANSLDRNSVREALSQNAGLVVRRDWHREKSVKINKLFKDEVFELFYLIDGLKEHARDASEKGIKLDLDPSKRLSGWEYMDLLSGKRAMELKAFGLRKSCGHWPEFSEDLAGGAITFFGTGFGDLFLPYSPEDLCSPFKTVPTEKDYFVIETSTLGDLYQQRASADWDELTSTGLRWKQSLNAFLPCSHVEGFPSPQCTCERIQELVPKRAFVPPKIISRVQRPDEIHPEGAVIFGKGNSTWLNLKSRFSSQQPSEPILNLPATGLLPNKLSHSGIPPGSRSLKDTGAISPSNRSSLAAPIHPFAEPPEQGHSPPSWKQDTGTGSIYSHGSARISSLSGSSRSRSRVASSFGTNDTSISSFGYETGLSPMYPDATPSSSRKWETKQYQNDLAYKHRSQVHSLGAGNHKDFRNVPIRPGNPARQPAFIPQNAIDLSHPESTESKGKLPQLDRPCMPIQYRRPQEKVALPKNPPALTSYLSDPSLETQKLDNLMELSSFQTLRKKPRFVRSEEDCFERSSEA